MKLTFEKTRGTRTIYFPLDKSDEYQADLTVMIRPFQADPGEQFDETDEFEAGIAICNPADQFVKRRGRAIAFERLNSEHRLRGSAEEIRDEINERITRINKRRDSRGGEYTFPDYYVPDMDEGQIAEDMAFVLNYDVLSAYFLKKDENRGDQLVLEA
jgi:hypothetical protein